MKLLICALSLLLTPSVFAKTIFALGDIKNPELIFIDSIETRTTKDQVITVITHGSKKISAISPIELKAQMIDLSLLEEKVNGKVISSGVLAPYMKDPNHELSVDTVIHCTKVVQEICKGLSVFSIPPTPVASLTKIKAETKKGLLKK
jgi:hypothetical protein